MSESPALLAQLRMLAAVPIRPAAAAWAVESWMAQGVAGGQVHELFAAAGEDGAQPTGFAVALVLAAGAVPLLWLRTDAAERRGGRLHATGLVELGLSPDDVILAIVDDDRALLRAAADASRCAGLGTVIVETRGHAAGLDLTATRRLQLAAEASGVTVLLLRLDAEPVPSAAATRWRVGACPSTALAADAPGGPAWLIDLERRRGGPAGQRWRVEWDREQTQFRGAALSGAGLPLATDRPAALYPPASVRAHG